MGIDYQTKLSGGQEVWDRLPEGWEKTTLGEISQNVMYGLNARATHYDGKHKYIRITDIDDKTNKFSPNPLTSPYGLIDPKYKLTKGDLLFARTGASVGKSYLYDESDGEVYFAGFLIRFHIVNQNSGFIFYQFQSKSYWKWAKSVSMRSSQPGINAEEFKKVPILLPPLHEQTAIATILQTWDTAIETTEALIAAKEKQFVWMVKAMTTGPSHKLGLVELKNIASIKKGQQLNRTTLKEFEKYPVWNGGVTPSGYTDKYNTREKTITISEGGNSCGFVNYSNKKFWLGGHCYALVEIVSTIYPEFLFFYLKSKEKSIKKLRVGSGLPNIQKKSIETIEIAVPPLPKQQRIAHILNSAQHEIDLLKKLADRYRTQKRGLMQKLLTGQWRVNKLERTHNARISV
jgi:type I restriction enzyme S subunit